MVVRERAGRGENSNIPARPTFHLPTGKDWESSVQVEICTRPHMSRGGMNPWNGLIPFQTGEEQDSCNTTPRI